MISLKKSKSFLLIFLVIAAIGSFALYKYMYKPHKTIQEIKASYIGESKDFLKKVEVDYSVWYTKTVELTGKISSVVDHGFILDDFMFCQLKEDTKNLKKGETITVKGTIIGYDELLNELKLNQCIIK